MDPHPFEYGGGPPLQRAGGPPLPDPHQHPAGAQTPRITSSQSREAIGYIPGAGASHVRP
eukprot:6089592-Pyramimonas_sp.AAC.1